MNEQKFKILKELRADLFYQIEAKFGAEKASEYPSIIKADEVINVITDKMISKTSEMQLRQLFQNRSDCYADMLDDSVVMAMSEDGFIDVMNEILAGIF